MVSPKFTNSVVYQSMISMIALSATPAERANSVVWGTVSAGQRASACRVTAARLHASAARRLPREYRYASAS